MLPTACAAARLCDFADMMSSSHDDVDIFALCHILHIIFIFYFRYIYYCSIYLFLKSQIFLYMIAYVFHAIDIASALCFDLFDDFYDALFFHMLMRYAYAAMLFDVEALRLIADISLYDALIFALRDASPRHISPFAAFLRQPVYAIRHLR